MAAMAAHVDFHPEIVECTGPRVEKQIERLTSLENCVCVADHFSPEFQNKFLADYAADQGKHHSSLEDAMTACRLDPSAGGVTKEAVDKFTVRKGTILMNSGPPESSWFKTKVSEKKLVWSAHTLLNPGVGPGALKNAARAVPRLDLVLENAARAVPRIDMALKNAARAELLIDLVLDNGV